MTLQEETDAIGPWYHVLQLPGGVVTKSYTNYTDLWDAIRSARKLIDYKGKTVLDLGTMDGMWAFEAEQLTDGVVVAGDVWPNKRFIFAQHALRSRVFPLLNADVRVLHDRLESTMRYLKMEGFDIIQFMGVLYHLQNPIIGLQQIRRCLVPGGVMLLETACCVVGDPDVSNCRFNRNPMLYNDGSTYWLPNLHCLTEMLAMVGFSLNVITRLPQWNTTERIAGICEQIEPVPPR